MTLNTAHTSKIRLIHRHRARLVITTTMTAFLILIAVSEPISAQKNPTKPLPGTSLVRRQQANLKAAEVQLRNKLTEGGEDPYVEHRLASVLFQQGKVLEARKLWDKAAQAEPNLTSADVSVALDLIGKGDLRNAQLTLASAEQRNAEDPHLHIARADVAIKLRQMDAAERELEKALELNPKLMATNVVLGRFAQSRGDLPKAEKFFRNAAAFAPKRPEGWLLLAALQFRSNEIEQALESLRQADGTGVDRQSAEERLAGFYYRNNDFIGALKWYKQAVSRLPENVDLRIALAQVKSQLPLKQEAKQDLKAVLKDNENLTALIALAQLEQQHKQFDSAAKLYRRALALSANNLIANNNLAMILMIQGKSPKEALQLAERARRAAPDNASILGTYACVLLHADRADKAKTLLSQIVRRLPADPWVRYSYGKLLHGEKNAKAAREHLEGCLILDADFPRKDEVRQMLDSLPSKSQ